MKVGKAGQCFLVLGLMAVSACGSSESKKSEQVSAIEGYIRGDTYQKLVLEIDTITGMDPDASVETDLIAGLTDILDKPKGVTVIHDGDLSSRGTDYAWTFDELKTLADDTFDLAVEEDTTKMHVLFVDGHHADNSEQGKVLGLAWENRHMVIFKQTIEESCGGLAPLIRDQVCTAAELSVWIHEVGHVLGLVNTGLDMVTDHQDVEHGAHDTSDECVMYWAYEGEAVIDLLRDRIIGGKNDALRFDQACLDDIAAVRERTDVTSHIVPAPL